MDLSTLMPQQREIVTTLDQPLFVSAGAGSGKTFTLTRRILWALSPESGPFIEHVDQVLAITFTKDAAAEIRERVRGALIEEGMGDEALLVDDAWISTIHGMCSRILRAHALELGLDPEFSVVEDTDELIGQAVDRVIAQVEQGEGAIRADELAALLSWYPLKGETGPSGYEASTSAQGLVRRLLELACSLPHGMDDVHLARGDDHVPELADAYRACLDASPKAAEIGRAAICAIETYEASGRTVADLTACMMSCEIPRASKALPKEQIELLRADVADTFINAYLAVGAPALDALMGLARAVEREYRSLKLEASALDNNDLLRIAYEALRDHEAIRAAYADRFRLVMIDEFQDTDQQQVDLIGYLTDGGRRLCTVGDAQQSIYRFRGAEVEVFRRQERSIASSAAGASGEPAAEEAPGRIVRLVKNFRSHAEILEYVARIFDGEQGGLMQGFLDLQAHDGCKDSLVADASRRQAVFVAGGTSEERAEAKAKAVARRFRELADAGQPVGDMVLLLGAMTFSGVYADAIRAEGLDCVIAGGSVFSSTPEVKAVRALACALANPADTAQGLVPLLASPMFALGATEFLALSTAVDPETGETRRRNADAGIMSDDDAPGLDGQELLSRARTVLRAALSRVGRDPFAAVARDAVRESGWLVRLAARGPEGRAVAANVLKALDMLGEAEARVGRSPRRIVRAFDTALAGKQAPGAINEQGGAAVRIMTVHASKGLEFPVVAVAECYGCKRNTDRMQTRRLAGAVEAAAMPARFAATVRADGSAVIDTDVEKRFKQLYSSWLTSEAFDDVCATGSSAEAFISMREEAAARELEEKARLLYVAMTRARELLILVMDGRVGTGKVPELAFDEGRDLTRAVLERILPNDGARLDVDRLVFDNARTGDFELIALRDFVFAGESYAATAADGDEERLGSGAADALDDDAPDSAKSDTFTLVHPLQVDWRVSPEARPERVSYSYSSISAALHAEQEDRAEALGAQAIAAADEASASLPEPGAEERETAFAPSAPAVLDVVAADASEAAAEPASAGGDPTALGSAFHAAAQWLIETGAAGVPAARVDALARYWKVTPAQRERLESALARWEASSVRAELVAWPQVRAEVPFFSLGLDDAEISSAFGAYAEGAIDALATDPARPDEALVIDYKTGGSEQETPERLHEKHALQARVYADVLHKAGFAHVTLKFVRVEVPEAGGSEPQVVTYRL